MNLYVVPSFRRCNFSLLQRSTTNTLALRGIVFLSTSSAAKEQETEEKIRPRARGEVVTHHYNSFSKKRARSTTTTTSSTGSRRRRTVASNRHDAGEDATALVDGLLQHTRSLMMGGSSSAHTTHRHHVIAFSGGVDSSLVAALVHYAHQQLQTTESSSSSVLAVLGVSAAVPAEQVELAERVAAHVGIALKKVETNEGSDATYVANAGQACLACKTHLYSTLQAIVKDQCKYNNNDDDTKESSSQQQQQQQQQQQSLFLYNGTNADDLLDPTRLGLIAAARFQVQSPLVGITKHKVRMAARHLNLPNWNAAASPCLRSRLALGVPATQQHLNLLERAERHVRTTLLTRQQQQHDFALFDTTSNLRVRLLAGNRACIEVDEEVLQVASEQDWEDFFVAQLGFRSVGVRLFKSGAVATRTATTATADEVFAKVDDDAGVEDFSPARSAAVVF